MILQVEEKIGTYRYLTCLLCGSEGVLLYKDLRDHLFGAPGEWTIKKCSNPDCGTIWLDPMPSKEDISKAYKRYYTHGPEDRDLVNQFGGERSNQRRLKTIRSYFKRAYYAPSRGATYDRSTVQKLVSLGIRVHPIFFRKFKRAGGYLPLIPGGKLLDVGCGDGLYLDYMRRLGWEVEGIEVDERAVGLARQRGLLVHCGTLEKHRFEDNRFNAVVLSHVVEHVHDPVRLLRECHRVLKTKGLIRVFIPNTNSYGHLHFKSNWIGLDPPRHLRLFTAVGLKEIAMRAGFNSTVRTNSVFSQFNWFASSFLAAQRRGETVKLNARRTVLKSFLFDIWESVGLICGKEWGEEIVLLGEKDSRNRQL